MKRSLFGAVATSSAAATTTITFSPTIMSHRTSFRGGRGWGRGRRSYSDSSVGEGDYPPQFVTGDSHFRQVQDSNRGCRSPNSNRGNYYNPRPPQPPSGRPYGAPPPRQSQQQHQPTYQNQQSFWSPSPRYDTNQQFRPHLRQQFKPRPPKELEFRNWEHAKHEPPLEFERFTILSYNILADYLALEHRQKLYFHLPSYMMDWEWRKRSIVFELGLWSADILCLQEVDRFQDLKEALELRGYSGIWKMLNKYRRLNTLSNAQGVQSLCYHMRTGDPVDGCAVFWRNSRFKLLLEESIEFNKLGLRDNVAQICVFESLYRCNDSEAAAPVQSSIKANKVVVCNIHVLFNPRRGEIKLGQIRVLLSRAHAVSKLWDDAPIIVCGDFNSTPKSPLYNFIADQKLNLSELPRDQVSGQASAEIQPPRPSCPETGAQPTGSQVLPAANLQKQDNGDKTSGNGNYEGTLSESFSPAVQEAVQSCMTTKYANEEVNKELRENDLEDFDGCIGENGSAIDASHGESEDNAGALPDEAAASGSPVKAVIDYSCSLDVKMETLSLTEVLGDQKEGEDENTCLSASSSEVDESFKECTSLDSQGLYTIGSELLNNIPAVDPGIIDMEKPKYDSSAWTPGEIEAATGSLDCTMMEHPLKLRSVYTEVEDLLGTRDSTGEPSITSYHRRFFGTVDYIWRSEGLQTSMVLAPIPKHAMKWTRGFPTKKWGSDHIALVSELAFRNDISNAC